jgi:hypothetical protein
MIKVPTQAQLDTASAAFAADWALVDDVLYGICRRWPTHTDRGQVVAKVHRRDRQPRRRTAGRGGHGAHRRAARPPGDDSYAVERLGKLVHWDKDIVPLDKPKGADPDYWDFCVRLFRLYRKSRDAGREVTVKSLDAFLWEAPT